jgi:phosphoglycerol transferase MdoB-like AlkP superfamily enzyme
VESVTVRDEVAGTFLTLPGLLKQRGFQTVFIYGGPAHRDHRQTFLGSNGLDRFVVENDLPVRTFRTSLGWNDRDLFRSAIQVLNDLPDDRPFLALMLTLTFHRSYEFPGSDRLGLPAGSDEEQLAAIRFCDQAVGEFIDTARRQRWFDDTIFVFVADHMGGVLQYPSGPWMNRIPLIFYGPAIEGLEPRRVDGVRSQMDLAPTVMGLLGGSYEHTFFGRDLLRDGSQPGYALTVDPDGELSFYRQPETITYVPPRSASPVIYRFDYKTGETSEIESVPADEVRDAVALEQLADRLFHRLRFNVGPVDPAPVPTQTAASGPPSAP